MRSITERSDDERLTVSDKDEKEKMMESTRKIYLLLTMVVLAALITSAPATAVISEGASEWGYEGRVMPGSDGWNVWTGTYQSQSIVDGEALRFTWSGGSACYSIWDDKQWMNGGVSNTWTIDWRARVSVAQGSPLPASWEPLQIDATPYTTAGQGMFAIKLGVTGNPTAPTNTLSFQDYKDGLWNYTSVAVSGLDITQWNNYRMVGVDATHYSVYVNGIAAPVYTGELYILGSNLRPFMLGWQLRFAEDSNNLITGDTDYIRTLKSTSLNEAPVPEPTSLLALGSGLLGLIGAGIRRRK